MPSTLKTWLKRVWQKDGDSHQDSTLAYSEMPGELDKVIKARIGQEENTTKDPRPLDVQLREKGLL
jgi:putative NADPH-quinone reductase